MLMPIFGDPLPPDPPPLDPPSPAAINDLEAAILAWWAAEPELAGLARPSKQSGPIAGPYPLATYFFVSGPLPRGETMGPGYWEESVIHFDIWTEDDDVGGASLANLVEARMDRIQANGLLNLGIGYLMEYRRVDGGSDIDTPSAGGAGPRGHNVSRYWRRYLAKVGRSKPTT